MSTRVVSRYALATTADRTDACALGVEGAQGHVMFVGAAGRCDEDQWLPIMDGVADYGAYTDPVRPPAFNPSQSLAPMGSTPPVVWPSEAAPNIARVVVQAVALGAAVVECCAGNVWLDAHVLDRLQDLPVTATRADRNAAQVQAESSRVQQRVANCSWMASSFSGSSAGAAWWCPHRPNARALFPRTMSVLVILGASAPRGDGAPCLLVGCHAKVHCHACCLVRRVCAGQGQVSCGSWCERVDEPAHSGVVLSLACGPMWPI
eukprot:jgi/Mesvir1/12156/Mv26318-RA.1